MTYFCRVLSLLMVLLLVSSLALPVLADTWYLEDGSVTIEATSSDGGSTQTQTVTQNGTTTSDAAPVVTQRDSGTATSNNITVESSGGATVIVTVENINIDTGKDSNAIDVTADSQAVITVSGDNKVQSGGLDGHGNYSDVAAVHVGDGGTVVIQGDSGDGTVDSLDASLEKSMGAAIGTDYMEEFTGTLILKDLTVTAGSGAVGGSAIGSGLIADNSGTIFIDDVQVTAQSEDGAGIGSGSAYEFNGTVIVTGQSQVESTSLYGAGIGSGYTGDYSGTVIIADSSTVTARSQNDGAGIGSGGKGGYSGTVIIADGSTVTVASSWGAGIGTGDTGEYFDQGRIIQESGTNIEITTGNNFGSTGLGAGTSREADIQESVDLPTMPATPVPLPWNASMFPHTSPPEAQAIDYDLFWTDVIAQLHSAKKGDTVTVDAGRRTTMPASVMEAIEETGVILIIQWNGGEDITITKPYSGEKRYWIFSLSLLPDLLAE